MPPDALFLEQTVRDLLLRGRSVTILALGNSMFPALVPGASLRLVPEPLRKPRPGDIVAVPRPDGGIAIHRAVRVFPDLSVLTWGDALPQPDDWGPCPVLAWPRTLSSPWTPSPWSLLKGHLRARSHVLSSTLFPATQTP